MGQSVPSERDPSAAAKSPKPSKKCTDGASEQKDAPLETILRVSEQKDAPLKTILGASEQKDTPLETILRASERQPLLLDIPTRAPKCQPLLLDIPTRAPKRQPLPLENILEANGCHRPIKWFPTEANERRAHVSENIPGADERQAPPSDVRVGAQKHTPPMFRAGNNSARQVSAAIGKHFGGERMTAAIVERPCRGVLHTPPMFRAENNSARQRSAAIGNHFGSQWIAMAREMVSDGSESAFWGPIRFQVISK